MLKLKAIKNMINYKRLYSLFLGLTDSFSRKFKLKFSNPVYFEQLLVLS